MGIATAGPKDVEDLRHGLDLRPMTLALAPEYRRSAVYGMIGLVLIPVIAWSLRDVLPRRGPATFIAVQALVVVIGFGPVVLRWRQNGWTSHSRDRGLH
jgi:hypothetical protein